jgi:nitrite reductase/ring-hydroxylating ferredoxin subunit
MASTSGSTSQSCSSHGEPVRSSRRIVFQGLGALGVAAVLAGCGGDDGGGGAAPESGSVLATTSEVPVGGGIVLTDQKVVITQPVDGTFVAFNTACTHTGTPVDEIDGTDIVCPNHGSRFSTADGSVTQGPATSPLERFEIEVDGQDIVAK